AATAGGCRRCCWSDRARATVPASQTGAAAVQRDGDACILGPGRGWDTALAGSELPLVEGYRILRVVGHGGMSTVYLAEQESLGRKVALKVMLAEALADEVSRARFENEARIIARLEHRRQPRGRAHRRRPAVLFDALPAARPHGPAPPGRRPTTGDGDRAQPAAGAGLRARARHRASRREGRERAVRRRRPPAAGRL